MADRVCVCVNGCCPLSLPPCCFSSDISCVVICCFNADRRTRQRQDRDLQAARNAEAARIAAEWQDAQDLLVEQDTEPGDEEDDEIPTMTGQWREMVDEAASLESLWLESEVR